MSTSINRNKSVFLNPNEVSELTGYSLKALASHRSKKEGFPFYKFGKKVFYKESEVLAEIEKTRVETTSKSL